MHALAERNVLFLLRACLRPFLVMDDMGLRLQRVAVVQEGNVQRLAGVADIVGQDAGRIHEFRHLVVLHEREHGIENLPDTEWQQAAMLQLDIPNY